MRHILLILLSLVACTQPQTNVMTPEQVQLEREKFEYEKKKREEKKAWFDSLNKDQQLQYLMHQENLEMKQKAIAVERLKALGVSARI